MPVHPRVLSLRAGIVLACVLAAPVMAQAQPVAQGGWSFDPAALAQGGEDIVQRAPDAQIDALFQAVHGAARVPAEATAICVLFAPDADRSLTGLSAAISRLGPASRDRFAGALADILLSASGSTPQPYDAAAANQALKKAAVTAAIRNDGFVAALNGQGTDAASQQGRCNALRWLLDAAALQPIGDRAAMTRLLMRQGLQRIPATG